MLFNKTAGTVQHLVYLYFSLFSQKCERFQQIVYVFLKRIGNFFCRAIEYIAAKHSKINNSL
jgi:hypothetical protein